MANDSCKSRTNWTGAVFVLIAGGFQALWLGLPAVLLSVALIFAFGVWVSRPWSVTPRLRVAFVCATLLFPVHVAEEYVTGFHRDLPALFDSAPWSDLEFLVFNGAWATVFFATALALRTGRRLPVLVVLFFAIAGGIGNGVAHLVLALQRGGYFPGTWTSPLCLAVGVWLLRLLFAQAGAVSPGDAARRSPSTPYRGQG